VKLGKLKKHLGMKYDWKQLKLGNSYLEASMPKMIEEISEKFEKARGKPAKIYATLGIPGKMLRKNEGTMVDLDAFKSIVGKIMYYATKIVTEICNAVRELASRTPIKPRRRTLESIGAMCWLSGTRRNKTTMPKKAKSVAVNFRL
jgi:hypothetical protein